MRKTPNQSPPVRKPLDPETLGEAFLDCAVEALGSAFMVWILGSVALSIAAGFAHDMVPSPPPFLPVKAEADSSGSWFGAHWWHSVKGNGFAILFGVFFVHSLWVAFRQRAEGRAETGIAKRVAFIIAKVREDWFEMIVGNAIGAWVAAMVLVWASGFSFTQMFWHWVLGLIFPEVQGVGESVIGHDHWTRMQDWVSWYDANQMKLSFWFFYLAGICDDLGLPNFKTLGRWGWRRWKKRNATGCEKKMDARQIQPGTASLLSSPPVCGSEGVAPRDGSEVSP